MTETNYSHFPYLPHTEEDRQEMLKKIGVRSFEELVKHIPDGVRAEKLDLRPGLSELELTQHISALASKNTSTSKQSSFLGGGSYRRFVPSVVPSIISRSEFATAYTPYQPEVSQGSLQIIYEFQTAVCLLTGMEVANASMYDGPTACAEAALMAARLNSRQKVIASRSVNPEYRMVTQTYLNSCGLIYECSEQVSQDGLTASEKLNIDQDTAAVIVQYPNYFGLFEDVESVAKAAHDAGALLVVVTDAIAMGLLTPPGLFGADIVVGDAQPCGNSLSFGGPSAGFMACRKDFVRQLPGRLAGMTVDNRGNRAFTLTLQTREQHIRRAKATSNICTNQALNALAMLVYLTMMGPQGIKQLASISLQRANYLADKLAKIAGVKLLFTPFFNEFAVALEQPVDHVLEQLKQRGILGGLALKQFYPELDNALLVAVTEMNSVEELDRYAAELAAVLGKSKTRAASGKETALPV
ncbi:MAG TPA: aminomethyl-transferring glycine dehydrogenase subunit GcvPA [Planktothrix sp.]